MRVLYLVSVSLHILAASTWLGGMAFVVFVAVPWLRQGDRRAAANFFRETGHRLRRLGWTCFALLLVTGSFNLWVRGVRLADFANATWRTSPFAKIVLLKLGLFTLVLACSSVHDFFIGPRATLELAGNPASARAAQLRRSASLLGRANAILALALVACAVMIVRGLP